MSEHTRSLVKPGMSHVATAGEVLLIEDNTGEQIAIETRDSPVLLAFVVAFDNYYAARREGISGVVLETLWQTTVVAYHALPLRVHRELPSFKALGLVVP